ncbi:nuclear transport factor 2 family protein [Flavobacterium sp.]|uniref:nuclear transport factor 2 family protein n=1 Tax=Flavobacterium sp. TaxID=239 RepID=UPI0012162D4B|nr:nuclear transport factor 2 family protein [Flavobacterium sp.]RZJ69503.1 MAG: nuclear transport factor 2 family protein [Flavobacterium sp.]
MKLIQKITTAFLLLLATQQTAAQSIENTIRQNDSLFWNAYNACEIEKMHAFVAEDLEFYHDKGGLQNSWLEFKKAMSENICGKKDWHLRREAVRGSVKFYVMEKNNEVYGAILSGEHKFFVSENGKPEYETGAARFTHLWLLENGQWKMKRILSFDHQPAHYANERKIVSVQNKKLKQFQGKYGSGQGVITVAPGDGKLLLTLGENRYELWPESETVYFTKERDLTFEFVKVGAKVSELIIKERGSVVEKASKTN